MPSATHSHNNPHTHTHIHSSHQSPIPEQKGQRGIIEDIVMSILEPGVNRGVIIMMHVTFIALLGSLLCTLALTEARNIHVWILLVIAALLYGSIVWYKELSWIIKYLTSFRFVKEMTIALKIQSQLEQESKKDQ